MSSSSAQGHAEGEGPQDNGAGSLGAVAHRNGLGAQALILLQIMPVGGDILPPDFPAEEPQKQQEHKPAGGVRGHGKNRGHPAQGLDHAADQGPEMADPEQPAIDRLKHAAGQKKVSAHGVEQVSAHEGHRGPSRGPQDPLPETYLPLGQGVAHEDGVEITGFPARPGRLELLLVHPVVHHVVEGVHRGIGGEHGQQPQGDYPEGRQAPIAEERRQGRGGQVQQAMGRAGQRQKELDPGESYGQGGRRGVQGPISF